MIKVTFSHGMFKYSRNITTILPSNSSTAAQNFPVVNQILNQRS